MSPSYLLLVITLGIRELSALCSCPDTWTVYKQSCYFRGHVNLTFLDAEKFCQNRHGHLVHINDGAENIFLKSFLLRIASDFHWIGLTDQDIEGIWQWYDTDTKASFLDWFPGQPDQAELSNCAAMRGMDNNQWVDRPCTLQYPPVCEQPCLTADPEIIG